MQNLIKVTDLDSLLFPTVCIISQPRDGGQSGYKTQTWSLQIASTAHILLILARSKCRNKKRRVRYEDKKKRWREN